MKYLTLENFRLYGNKILRVLDSWVQYVQHEITNALNVGLSVIWPWDMAIYKSVRFGAALSPGPPSFSRLVKSVLFIVDVCKQMVLL